MRLERHRLDNHDFEPLIRPTLCLHERSPGFEQRECRGGFALGQVDARPTDREVVCPSHKTCLRDMALAKQRQHPCGGNVGQPKQEVMLAHKRFGFIQSGDRAGHVVLGQSQAGEKYQT